MYYPNLTQKDRALILQAYNEWRTHNLMDGKGPLGPEAHHGLLPFIGMDKIGTALTWKAASAHENRRIWATLCSKVEASRWNYSTMPAHSSWELVLNNAAVHKHFGPRPELGVQLPTIPRGPALGPLKWHVAYREWRHEQISAAPRITLCKVRNLVGNFKYDEGKGVWMLHCPTRYKELAINWLLDHC